jgi:cell division protein FtsN
MKQNKNFNFQSISSANEKMLIIFSWIIVVIIVVLVGLYYGQQVREQEVSAARVQSTAAPQDVEVSSDSDSRIEEGEMSARSAASVLTDSMALNKNEVFCVQIGSHEGPDFYNSPRTDAIISEFSSRGTYSKKIIVNPEKDQHIVQLGIFKNYEDAKTFLNSVKLKNYPAEIAIVPDPNAKIGGSQASVPAAAPAAEASVPKKEVVVSTPDSKIAGELKTPAATPAAEKSPAAQVKPAAVQASEVKVPEKIEKPATVKAPEIKIPEKVEPAAEEPAKSNFKIIAAKAEENKPAPADPAVKTPEPAAEEIAAEEIKPAEPKKEPKPKSPPKEVKTPAKAAPVEEAEDEITAGDDEFEIVADDEDATQDGGKGPYYIQIGTYKSNSNADGLKAKLKKMGVSNVAIVPGKVASGDSVYRVRITGYASKDSAGKAFSGIKGAFPEVKPYISK